MGRCRTEWLTVRWSDVQPVWAERSNREWHDCFFFPPADPLPQDNRPMPYFILGDDAFALRTWLMKPFCQWNMSDEQRIFNYSLSRGRYIVENAFGILANQFQCLLSPLLQQQRLWTQLSWHVSVSTTWCGCVTLVFKMLYSTKKMSSIKLCQEDGEMEPTCRMWTIRLVTTDWTFTIAKKQKQHQHTNLGFFKSPQILQNELKISKLFRHQVCLIY